MKNIHVISTEKPRKYRGGKVSTFTALASMMPTEFITNIYITSDEKIKEGYYGLIGNEVGKIILTEDGYEFLIGKGVSYEYGDFYSLQKVCKKIILTTDQDLIKDGVQAIDDEFLEWFVKNPSCEEIAIDFSLVSGSFKYKITIPKEEPKQETFKKEIK